MQALRRSSLRSPAHRATRAVVTAAVLGGLGLLIVRSGAVISTARADQAPVDLGAAVALAPRAGVADLERRHLDWADAEGARDPAAGRAALETLFVHAISPEVRAALPGRLAAAATGWPDDARGDFLRSVAPAALESAMAWGLPPSVIMAQAIHESGWGGSSLARGANNLFGIKARLGEPSVVLPTVEHAGGLAQVTRGRFAAFEAPGQSLLRHGELLGTLPAYAYARAHAADGLAFLEAMAPVYATDPSYARRLERLIDDYGLDRWDDLVLEARAARGEALGA